MTGFSRLRPIRAGQPSVPHPVFDKVERLPQYEYEPLSSSFFGDGPIFDEYGKRNLLADLAGRLPQPSREALVEMKSRFRPCHDDRPIYDDAAQRALFTDLADRWPHGSPAEHVAIAVSLETGRMPDLDGLSLDQALEASARIFSPRTISGPITTPSGRKPEKARAATKRQRQARRMQRRAA